MLALLLGLGALLVARDGAGERPVIALVIVVFGSAAALLPFRYGLPAAIVLSGFEGFLLAFVGDRGRFWNEAFMVVLVGRSLVARLPSRRESAAVLAVVAAFSLYLAAGSSLREDAWGAKVLLTSAVVGWAVARLGVGRAEWLACYRGLTVLAGSGLVLAVWQRAEGVEGLQRLGLDYGDRIREVSGGGAVAPSRALPLPRPTSMTNTPGGRSPAKVTTAVEHLHRLTHSAPHM